MDSYNILIEDKHSMLLFFTFTYIYLTNNQLTSNILFMFAMNIT